jgi:hypothetical protein
MNYISTAQLRHLASMAFDTDSNSGLDAYFLALAGMPSMTQLERYRAAQRYSAVAFEPSVPNRAGDRIDTYA